MPDALTLLPALPLAVCPYCQRGTLLLIFVVFNVGVRNGDYTITSTLAPISIGMAVLVSHLVLGRYPPSATLAVLPQHSPTSATLVPP